jgi:hypothetical protein
MRMISLAELQRRGVEAIDVATLERLLTPERPRRVRRALVRAGRRPWLRLVQLGCWLRHRHVVAGRELVLPMALPGFPQPVVHVCSCCGRPWVDQVSHGQ